jgi:hypothetical protein
MQPKTAETLSWVFIYSGLLLGGLGLFLWPDEPTAAILLVVFGLCDTIAGAVLIWLRSRMNNNPEEKR